MSTYLYRLARWCYDHRRRVLVAWMVLAAAVTALGVSSHGKENNNITIPATESTNPFLVRLTLVPAVMAIAGGRMWHHPKWFAKYVPDPDIEGRRLEEQPATG